MCIDKTADTALSQNSSAVHGRYYFRGGYCGQVGLFVGEISRQESPAQLCVLCGCYLSRTSTRQVCALGTDSVLYLVTLP